MRDATYWAEKFKQKDISLVEYYTDLDKRVREINPELNAFVEWEKETVLGAARTFSLREDQPFSGVPIPLKMLGQNKAGWKSTFGSRLLAEHRSSRNSNFVSRLEKLGFVPAGQTNTPEFGLKNITDPVLYGPARNPWNTAYSPGGSSGGAAAAVASGLFPIAGASDGGGSIRMPAAFCGLIGLKPTRGAMPTGPNGYRGWQGAAIDFAVTVSMRDTETLFYAMRGNDKASPYHPPRDEWQVHEKDRPLKIAYLTASPVDTPVSAEAELALAQTATELEKLGHELTEVTWPFNGREVMESYYVMMGAETSGMFDGLQQTLARQLTMNDMELLTWGLYKYGETIPVKRYIHALNVWDATSLKMEQLFSTYDLLLTPTTADSAPRIDQEFQSDRIRAVLGYAEELKEAELAQLVYEMFDKGLSLTPYTQLANLAGQPAISLPTHLTAAGMPFGVQFMASKGREDLLFHIGKQLEEQQLFHLPKAYSEG